MCLEVVVSSGAAVNRSGTPVGARDDSMAGGALEKARAVQVKAAQAGFDWPTISGVLEKLDEEIAELREALDAGDSARIRLEFGDLMFSVVNVSRFVEASPSEELKAASRRFEERFEGLKLKLKAAGRAIHDCSPDELDEVWEQVKADLANGGGSSVA